MSKISKWRRKGKGKNHEASQINTGEEDLHPVATRETALNHHHQQQEDLELRGTVQERLKYHARTKGTFDESNLADLQNFLIAGRLSDRWFNIGIQLKVDTNKLENIRHQYPKYEDALREMLIIALRQSLSWEMVCAALKSPAVGGQRLVNNEVISPTATLTSVVTAAVRAGGVGGAGAEGEEVRSKPTHGQVPGNSALYSPRNSIGAATDLNGSNSISSASLVNPMFFTASPGSGAGTGPGASPEAGPETTGTPTTADDEVMESSISGYEKMPIYANKGKVNYTFKVVVVGDTGVGKTSLIERFALANPCETPLPTVGYHGEHTRVIKMPNGLKVKLEIWDTAGQERSFRAIPRSFFRNADAALVTFDITSKTSFDHATRDTSEKFGDFTTWVKETKLCLDDTRHVVIVLVGNKNDLKKRKVSYRDADQFAEVNHMDYIETSSKEDNNVDQLFFLVCQRLVGGPSVVRQSFRQLHRSNVRESRSEIIRLEDRNADSACPCGRRARNDH